LRVAVAENPGHAEDDRGDHDAEPEDDDHDAFRVVYAVDLQRDTSVKVAGRTSGDAAANGSCKITREVVLAAALEIIDTDGAEALSMRHLARALGRDPMILYRTRRTSRPCSTASPRSCSPSSRSTPPTPTGPPSCAPSPATTGGSRWPPHVVPLLVTRPLATPLALRRPQAPCARSKTGLPAWQRPTPSPPTPAACPRLPWLHRPRRRAPVAGHYRRGRRG
jgi:hypothetical protein